MTRILTNQRLVGVLILIVSLGYICFIRDIPLDFWSEAEPFNARTMPTLYGYGGLVSAALLILLPSDAFDWTKLKSLSYFPAALLLMLLACFGLFIDYLGFVVTSTLMLLIGFWILGERRLGLMIAVSLGLTLTFYFGLDLMGIYLDHGELWN